MQCILRLTENDFCLNYRLHCFVLGNHRLTYTLRQLSISLFEIIQDLIGLLRTFRVAIALGFLQNSLSSGHKQVMFGTIEDFLPPGARSAPFLQAALEAFNRLYKILACGF